MTDECEMKLHSSSSRGGVGGAGGEGGGAIPCFYADYGSAKQSAARRLTVALVTGYLEEW